MTRGGEVPRILHLLSPVDAGTAGQRLVRLANAFATDAEHAVVVGDASQRAAMGSFARGISVAWPDFPPLAGRRLPGRLKRLAQAMSGYDLVCTYGGGALDAALAHTLFADVFRLAPLVHHEDGSDDRTGGTFYRRLALGRSAAVVVTARRLEQAALESWQQARSKVRLIPDGIDLRAFASTPRRDALPRVIKRKGELWVGTLADLREAEDLPALVRAFGVLPEPWQLVIVGQGPDRAAVLAEAESSGLEHRVHLPGALADPARAVGLFDIFALSSGAVPPPGAVIEAMAAGLPVCAPRAGDVAATLASENGPLLTTPGDEAGLGEALSRLAADPALRQRIGEANRAKAHADYDEKAMFARYRALYWGLMGRGRGFIDH